MSATDRRRSGRARERGVSLVASFSLVLVLGAFSLSLASSSMTRASATRARVESSRAFHVAEGGLDLCAAELARDPLWPVTSADAFPTVDADGAFVSRTLPFGDGAGSLDLRIRYERVREVPSDWTQPGLPPGFVDSEPVRHTSRAPAALPPFDRIVVDVRGRAGGAERAVRAQVRREFTAFGTAIVSDALSLPGAGGGKGWALSNRTVVLNGEGQSVVGGIDANGGVYLRDSVSPVSGTNAAALLPGVRGAVRTYLAGTADEVPDYTDPGSDEQLFDLRRYRAAALSGRGAVFPGLALFAVAMNAANVLGTPLEGVIVVDVHCALEGASPRLTSSLLATGLGSYPIVGGINVKGTLVFNFIGAPDRYYRVVIDTPLRVNAADLPADYSPAVPSTWRTGYPPRLHTWLDPRRADLSRFGFASFKPTDDLPALIFNTGTVDIRHEANICGAVYGPAFIGIENARDERQYFNGIVIGGGGIYLRGSDAPGASQQFVYDRRAIDELATHDGAGTSLVVTRAGTGR